MQGHKRVATPEQLADYAARALYVEDMAFDAGAGVAYLLCRKSRLEIGHTVIAVDHSQLASLAITYIQVADAVRQAASDLKLLPPETKQ